MENLKPRTIVLCFDGTANEYSDANTNVVKFFSLLKKDDFHEQLCYYQPGIGTWFDPGVVAPVFRWGARLLDKAVAWYMDAHVIEGYKFLMRNYRVGDKICIFGFSRGAYTARALAGALHGVGLLSKDNEQQIPFAYKMYKRQDKLCEGFKRTFCQTVNIEFVGVWDTVESVGILWSRSLPFTNSNTAIKTFRHALSLDEHRAKFRPNPYHRIEGEKDPTDVLEVWFAGGHCDVGGSSEPDTDRSQLSDITLRWMIREVIKSQCGIQFDEYALSLASIPDFSFLVKPTNALNDQQVLDAAVALDTKDAVEPCYDQLGAKWIWWILEIIPLYFNWQDEKGNWHPQWWPNFGFGRKINTSKPLFHTSVKQREADPKLKYKPRAYWTAGSEGYVY